MPEINRPLSPHLGIYKWSVSMALSIVHRATGSALSLAAVALVVWLVAVATGGETFTAVTAFLTGWFGKLLLLGFSASFFYHLGNGIRHLFWDAGYGFDKNFARLSGWVTFITAGALTALFWLGALT